MGHPTVAEIEAMREKLSWIGAASRGGTTGDAESSGTAAGDAGLQDGGQAFPRSVGQGVDGHTGMSLRDYFAAEALSKMTVNMSRPDNPAQEREAMSTAARMAYGLADAMLKERDKGKP